MTGVFQTDKLVSLMKLAERNTAFKGPNFDPENPTWEAIRVLVVGAGGLGCELLHCLALSGFTQIDVIDMDTIDLSNLNRQFLFREKDIGEPKSNVAANFINERFPWMKVVPHYGRIEDKPDDFYREFHICILGLDSIKARSWINNKFANLGRRVENGQSYFEAVPVIDGGTEGFKGSARVINYGKSACIQCTMSLFPPQRGVPDCTLANNPRTLEHCVLYVMRKSWESEKPFEGAKLDGDEQDHIVWVMERSVKRAEEFKIPGTIDFPFTQGVVKNVIPSVGFTNAIVAAMCVNEALKLATDFSVGLNNFSFYDGSKAGGVTSTVVDMAPDPECEVCRPLVALDLNKSWTPHQVIDEALATNDDRIAVGSSVQMVADFGEAVGRIQVLLNSSHPLAAVRNPLLQSKSVYETLVAGNAPAEALSNGFALEVSGGALGNEIKMMLGRFP